MTKRKTLILIATGLCVMSASQIFSQFIEFNDFVKGSFMGIGIGLLLNSIIFGRFKTAQ